MANVRHFCSCSDQMPLIEMPLKASMVQKQWHRDIRGHLPGIWVAVCDSSHMHTLRTGEPMPQLSLKMLEKRHGRAFFILTNFVLPGDELVCLCGRFLWFHLGVQLSLQVGNEACRILQLITGIFYLR